MNNFELAQYLSMRGHSVYENKGVDIEALLFEETTPRPINYKKLKEAAKKEGFVLTHAWVKEN